MTLNDKVIDIQKPDDLNHNMWFIFMAVIDQNTQNIVQNRMYHLTGLNTDNKALTQDLKAL